MNDTAAKPGSLALDSNLGPAGVEPLRMDVLGIIPPTETNLPGEPVRLNGEAVDQFGAGALQVVLAAEAQWRAQGRRLILERPSPRLCEWARLAGVSWLLEGARASDMGGNREER